MQAPERKKPGRKPLPAGEGKGARIELRTTDERKAKAERLALAAGLTLTTWWERAVDRARE